MTRKLHIVDIENLAGGESLNAYQRLVMYLEQVYSRGDLVFIASNRHIWKALAWDIPVGHKYIVSGLSKNAADNKLLTVIGEADLSAISEVVIGSGDHIFADTIPALRMQGLKVTVVGNRHSLSNALRIACNEAITLPPLLCDPDGNRLAPAIITH